MSDKITELVETLRELARCLEVPSLVVLQDFLLLGCHLPSFQLQNLPQWQPNTINQFTLR